MRNDYLDYLAHSSGPWKKHKYIKKVGSRYYYKTDFTDNDDKDDSRTRIKISTPYSDKKRLNIYETHYIDTRDSTRRTKSYEQASSMRDRNFEKFLGYQINRKKVNYVDARTGRRMSRLSVNAHARVNSVKKKVRQIQNGARAIAKRFAMPISKLFGRKKKKASQPAASVNVKRPPQITSKVPVSFKEYRSIPAPRKLPAATASRKRSSSKRKIGRKRTSTSRKF